MKKTLRSIIWATVILFGTACLAQAATLEDAKELGIKAAAFVKASGKDAGIKELNNPKGRFVKGEMYVTLHDFKGIFLANPKLSAVVGHNHWDLKDPHGKYFVREMIEIAKTKGGGWIEYSWSNPATKKIQKKKSWVQRVEGTDLYTLSGLFL
ncbi:MAG: cache domain-containing protein [Syntrophales bacterium]|nr:cache domain-containing protein [Syntrophales bacterium]